MQIFGAAGAEQAVKQTTTILHTTAHNVLNARSLMALVISIAAALLIGRFIAYLLRRVVGMIGASADKSDNLHTVNRLRRYETFIILSIAIIRAALIAFAFYFWWSFTHPGGRPTAILEIGRAHV